MLAELPLFRGLELRGLVELFTPVELEPAHALWHQGRPADALYIVVAGRLTIAARLPGGRESVLAELGPGEVLGELALLDGGTRTAGVRALERTRLMSLGLADFRSVVLSRDPGARELRRRLVALACARLGDRHRALARTLDGEPQDGVPARREPTTWPDPSYLLRLPFFRHFRRGELDDLLGRASVEYVTAGDVLLAEGEPSPGLFVTLHGAVEEVIRREGHTIRVALLGPGRGFGYPSLIDGGRVTATAAARERTVVFVLAAAELEHQFQHDTFASAIEWDIVHAHRNAALPRARLARLDGASGMRQSPTRRSEPQGRRPYGSSGWPVATASG